MPSSRRDVETQVTTPSPVRGRSVARPPGNRAGMFLFFSNRLGCAGSLLVSLAVTAVLLLVLVVAR